MDNIRQGVNRVSIVGRLSTLQSVHYQRFHCISFLFSLPRLPPGSCLRLWHSMNGSSLTPQPSPRQVYCTFRRYIRKLIEISPTAHKATLAPLDHSGGDKLLNLVNIYMLNFILNCFKFDFCRRYRD